MSHKLLFIWLIAVISVVLAGCNTAFVPSPPAYTLRIQFVNYIWAGLLEQDVFVRVPDSLDASRPTSARSLQQCDPCAKDFYVKRPGSTDALLPSFLAKQVYATTKVIAHDPYRVGVSAPGPFPAGDALGFTLGDWLAASGSGTYSVINGHAQLDLTFKRLVPNGTYSLWCGRETPPPNYGSSEAPCGTADGAQDQFRADAAGNASVSLVIKPVPPHTEQATTILSLSYDRVVANANDELGGYGFDNHVQLWYPFP